jgi:antitoxin VapB
MHMLWYLSTVKETAMSQDAKTGDVILSRKPANWDDFFAALQGAEVPADFLDDKERQQDTQERDPLEGLGA